MFSVACVMTSMPVRSAVASGPIGWPKPSRQAVSRSSAEMTPSSTRRAAGEARGREPGDVAVDDDAGLPGGLGEAAGGVERLVAGVEAAHELAELHHGHGREEVGADDPFGMRCGGGDLRDRDGRGVGREDRLGGADRRELAEDLLLDVEALEDRLDTDL
jgi:hypothetical protein